MNEIISRKNDIEMCLRHNTGKSVVAEIFIRTLRNKIYKYMTSKSKNVYIDKEDYIVKKYNNTCHSTTIMKPNHKDPKFKIDDIFKISKYQNNFAKGWNPNWSEEVFVKKTKIVFRGDMLLEIFKANKLLERFTKKNYKKQIKDSLGLNK